MHQVQKEHILLTEWLRTSVGVIGLATLSTSLPLRSKEDQCITE